MTGSVTPSRYRRLIDAAIGLAILVALVVGSVWLAVIASAVFGPENSGLFGRITNP